MLLMLLVEGAAILLLTGLAFVAGCWWAGSRELTDDDVVLRIPRDALYEQARRLVQHYASDGPSEDGGEWRRSQVYGRLLRRYPGASKQAIARAIEAAVSENGAD